MGITVSDIERKEFAYKGAGYDPYDVDQYLDQICDEMIAMQDKIVQLEKELSDAQREVEQAKHAAQPAPAEPEPAKQEAYARPAQAQPPVTRTSETLEAILVNAQRLADDAVENANRKADELLQKAKEEAEGITKGARDDKERIESEYSEMKEAAKAFKENFLQILAQQKSLLEEKLKETEIA